MRPEDFGRQPRLVQWAWWLLTGWRVVKAKAGWYWTDRKPGRIRL